jgi:hypothetical protein
VRQKAFVLVTWLFICALVAAVVVIQIRAQEPQGDTDRGRAARAIAQEVARDPTVATAEFVPGHITLDVSSSDQIRVRLTREATTTQVRRLLNGLPYTLERHGWTEALPFAFQTGDGVLAWEYRVQAGFAVEAPEIRQWLKAARRRARSAQ